MRKRQWDVGGGEDGGGSRKRKMQKKKKDKWQLFGHTDNIA